MNMAATESLSNVGEATDINTANKLMYRELALSAAHYIHSCMVREILETIAENFPEMVN